MNKEILDTLDDLSKRLTTELAMQLMETTADNMVKDKELERYKNIIDELKKWLTLQRDNLDKRVSEMETDDKNMTRANHYTFIYNRVIDKLKELKGSDE